MDWDLLYELLDERDTLLADGRIIQWLETRQREIERAQDALEAEALRIDGLLERADALRPASQP